MAWMPTMSRTPITFFFHLRFSLVRRANKLGTRHTVTSSADLLESPKELTEKPGAAIRLGIERTV
jgi:hypothetical protein